MTFRKFVYWAFFLVWAAPAAVNMTLALVISCVMELWTGPQKADDFIHRSTQWMFNVLAAVAHWAGAW